MRQLEPERRVSSRQGARRTGLTADLELGVGAASRRARRLCRWRLDLDSRAHLGPCPSAGLGGEEVARWRI